MREKEKKNRQSIEIYNNIINRHIGYNSSLALMPQILSRRTFFLHSSILFHTFPRGGVAGGSAVYVVGLLCVLGLLVCSGSGSV